MKPSGRSSASMPSARNPATSAAMRSLSLTRSSAAPLTVTSPPCAASAAMAGSSSIRPGISSGRMSMGCTRSCSTSNRAPRLAAVASAVPASISTSTRAPKRRRTSSSAVRVGLRPTSSISIREPGSAAAATSQNAAEEKSPGRRASERRDAGVRAPRRSARSPRRSRQRPRAPARCGRAWPPAR